MFQKIKNNSLDSLLSAKKEIIRLEDLTAVLGLKIDTLNKSLETARQDLDRMTKTKNSIRLLGINVNKAAYNAVMWIIVAILAGLLTIGFLVSRGILVSHSIPKRNSKTSKRNSKLKGIKGSEGKNVDGTFQ